MPYRVARAPISACTAPEGLYLTGKLSPSKVIVGIGVTRPITTTISKNNKDEPKLLEQVNQHNMGASSSVASTESGLGFSAPRKDLLTGSELCWPMLGSLLQSYN